MFLFLVSVGGYPGQAVAAPNVFVRIGNGGPIAALTLAPTDTVLDMKRMLLVGSLRAP